jgi:enoyl-CoA hydratase/carnithine racemase
MRFLLEQRMVPAAEAQQLGLVGEVVDASGFEERLVEYGSELAERAPIGARQTKRLVSRVGLPTDLEGQLRDEMSYVRRGLRSQDGREAVRAIMEKRSPGFRGR